MTARKKNSRQRGSHTHGWGAKKKHRGAGSRGGRGMAGTGKRGDAKKPSILKTKKYFGKHGFRPKGQKKQARCVNIQDVELMGKENINLKELGYNKLLGKGRPTRKYSISVEYATQKSIQKIEKAGGSVTLLKAEE
jgi:large subunit ribosomal protein L15